MLPKISSIFMRTGMFAFCQLRVLNYLVCMHSSSNILSDNSTFFHKIFPNSKHKVFQLPRSPITLPFLYIKYSLLQCNSIRYTFILFCIYIQDTALLRGYFLCSDLSDYWEAECSQVCHQFLICLKIKIRYTLHSCNTPRIQSKTRQRTVIIVILG